MSVTFIAQGAPEVPDGSYECQTCSWAGETEPLCRECGGGGSIHFTKSEGSLNMSNSNAAAMARLLGLGNGKYGAGSLERSGFPTLRRAIMRARNVESERALQTEAAYELRGGHAGMKAVEEGDGVVRLQSMGAAMTSFGRDDDYILRKLQGFEDLLNVADQVGSDYICWG